MAGAGLVARVRHWGISPWEVEVAHEYFGAMFAMDVSEAAQPPEGTVSYMLVEMPLRFDDEFFDWFGFRRWEKVKALFKEMKRRRGGRGGSLEIRVLFTAQPAVAFVIDSQDRQHFDNSVEKLDYVLEVVSHHRSEAGADGSLTYRFDPSRRRWSPASERQRV